MKNIISKGLLLVVGLTFLGENLAYAGDASPPNEALKPNDTLTLKVDIIVMDTEDNCFVIAEDNNVVDCSEEQVKQINRTLLVENIPANVAVLQQEDKCVVVSKEADNAVSCTEEESFALQLFTDVVKTAESKKVRTTKSNYKAVGLMIGGLIFVVGLSVMIAGPVVPAFVIPIALFMSSYGSVALSLLIGNAFIHNHWSDVSDLSEQAEILRRALKGKDFSLLREHIAKLQ